MCLFVGQSGFRHLQEMRIIEIVFEAYNCWLEKQEHVIERNYEGKAFVWEIGHLFEKAAPEHQLLIF